MDYGLELLHTEGYKVCSSNHRKESTMKKPIDYNSHLVQLDKIVSDLQKIGRDYIAEDYRSFLTLPAEFDKSNMEMIENITPEADDAHIAAWTEFKGLCE